MLVSTEGFAGAEVRTMRAKLADLLAKARAAAEAGDKDHARELLDIAHRIRRGWAVAKWLP